jgi:MerR family transcriptional regulator, thiopeptide resistance regulator
MERRRTYQVKDVTRIAGISVRTLHHYDEIGLLVPTARSPSGYRLYDDDDLLRLQQIIVARELGLSLEAIRKSLDDPGFDRRRALLTQRAQLTRRAQQAAEMIVAVDRALALMDARDKENSMDMKQLFNGFDSSKYEEEAKQRWGHTDAYNESTRRVQGYSAEDWQRFSAEQAGIYADAVAALQAGKPPDGPEAMAIAERHRLSIDRWFYPCSAEMHSALALGYEQDPRFAENIDKHGAGLTPYLVAAIRANSQRRPAP